MRSFRSLDLPARFCEITQLDPIEQLKLFPIGVLNSFFHWLLHERSDSLHAKSSVQTYWNALSLVRRNETGCCVIDLETKSEWQGVRNPPSASVEYWRDI